MQNKFQEHLDAWEDLIFKANSSNEKDKDLIVSFLQLVKKTPKKERQKYSVSDYAKALGLRDDSRRLRKACQKILHEPPINCIKIGIIKEALTLLKDSNLSIADIGHQLGMEESCYFIRYFSKAVGLPPNKARRHLREAI